MFEKVATLGEAWIRSLELVFNSGSLIKDDDDNIMELCDIHFEIESIYMDDIIERYADKERISIMIEKYFTCGIVRDYKIDYGSCIFNNNHINQIDWVINRLKNRPYTKSATISMHKAGEEHLSCLSLIDFKIREGQLNIGIVYRSQNVFASQPGNLLALNKIHKEVADKLSIPVGKVQLLVFSGHIYEKDFDSAREILRKNNRNT